MRLLALKTLPNGIPCGAIFTENDIMAGLLIKAGVAQIAPQDPRPNPAKRRPRHTDDDER